jgi:hypothetical protein
LEPLGFTRSEPGDEPAFHAPDADGGIYCDGSWLKLRLHIGSLEQWAPALQAIADKIREQP